MGQKVNPNGIRLGITKDWTSKWYANKRDYADYLNNDLKVRDFLMKKLKGAAISQYSHRTSRPQCARRHLLSASRRDYW